MWSNTCAGDGKSWCMIFYTTFVRVQANDSDVTRCCLRELEIRFVQFSFNRIFVICTKSKDPESPPGSLMIHSVLQTCFLIVRDDWQISYNATWNDNSTLLCIFWWINFHQTSISVWKQVSEEDRQRSSQLGSIRLRSASSSRLKDICVDE